MAELIPKLGNGVKSQKSGGKSKKNWLQKAVNPKHKGFCTPMIKSTCTGQRKVFAQTMKKHHGFHKKYKLGGTIDFLQPLIDQYKTSIGNMK